VAGVDVGMELVHRRLVIVAVGPGVRAHPPPPSSRP
jgi:hypothetical protein